MRKKHYWKNHLTSLSEYYKYLKYLNVEAFKPGKQHLLIFLPTMSARDTDRIPIKLKLVSGSYIFQSNRSKFNQSQIDATCLLCGEDEDLDFFLLRCQLLETTRQITIYAIDTEVNKIINRRMHQMSNEEKNSDNSELFILVENDITMKLG